jgi:TRAP-type C4-dicarboxylate transport system substrate-binding protein
VATSGSVFAQDRTAVRFAHNYPVTVHLHKGAETLANYFNEHNKRFTINLFPGGQLYTEKGLVEGVQNGALDISFVTTAFWGGSAPSVYVMNYPMLLGTHERGKAAMEGKFGKALEKDIEAAGVKVIGWMEYGLDNVIVNPKKSILTAADFKGLRIRSASPIHGVMVNTLGGGSVVMSASEVYMALQRGTFDAVISAPPSVVERKWNEVAKYATIFPLSYTSLPITVSLNFWNKLSPEEQQALLEAGRRATQQTREHAKEIDDKMRAEMRRTMEVTEMAPQAVADLKKIVDPKSLEYIKQVAGDRGVEVVKLAEDDVKNIKD